MYVVGDRSQVFGRKFSDLPVIGGQVSVEAAKHVCVKDQRGCWGSFAALVWWGSGRYLRSLP